MNLSTMRDLVRRDLKDEIPTPQTPVVLDDCDQLWTGSTYVTVSVDSDYKVGIGSMKAYVQSSFTTGLICYHNISSVDLRNYKEIRLWIKISTAIGADVLYIVLDDSANCASPVKYIALPALAVNVWYNLYIDLGDMSACGAISSIGVYINADPGDYVVRLDHIQVYEESYKWSDDELDRHIDHALNDYSLASPCEDSATIATSPGVRSFYTTSYSTLITIYAVEYPVDQFPPSYQRFSFFNKKVTLLGDIVPDGSNLRLYYGKIHLLDMAASTIPPQHEAIVALGAQGYALQAYASYGLDVTHEEYRYAQERAANDARVVLAEFHRRLEKLKSKLRPRQFYTPATSPTSKTTDFGP